jgi:hypothetical protein
MTNHTRTSEPTPQLRHATVIPAGPDDAHTSSSIAPTQTSDSHPDPQPDPHTDAQTAANAQANATFVMPGPDPAAQIAAVSPEGAPADAHAGPAALRSLLIIFAVIIIAAAGASIFWIGWAGAVVVLVVGLGSILLNPALGATWSRAKERKEIVVIDQLHSQGIDVIPGGGPSPASANAAPALANQEELRHP